MEAVDGFFIGGLIIMAFIAIASLFFVYEILQEREEFCEEEIGGEYDGGNNCLIEETDRLVKYEIVEYKDKLRLVYGS